MSARSLALRIHTHTCSSGSSVSVNQPYKGTVPAGQGTLPRQCTNPWYYSRHSIDTRSRCRINSLSKSLAPALFLNPFVGGANLEGFSCLKSRAGWCAVNRKKICPIRWVCCAESYDIIKPVQRGKSTSKQTNEAAVLLLRFMGPWSSRGKLRIPEYPSRDVTWLRCMIVRS